MFVRSLNSNFRETPRISREHQPCCENSVKPKVDHALLLHIAHEHKEVTNTAAGAGLWSPRPFENVQARCSQRSCWHAKKETRKTSAHDEGLQSRLQARVTGANISLIDNTSLATYGTDQVVSI